MISNKAINPLDAPISKQELLKMQGAMDNATERQKININQMKARQNPNEHTQRALEQGLELS